MNIEYTSELSRLEARTACNPTILEYVCYAKLHCKNEIEFANMLKKEFKEMTYTMDDNILSGSYEGEAVSLIIDSIFWRAAKKFMRVLDNNQSLYLYVKNKNDSHDSYDRYTIGEYLYLMDKTYTVRINQRFKGLIYQSLSHH